ncbi:MAG: competence/damage-inducible protein A [Fimbriimonadaceae bacterium]
MRAEIISIGTELLLGQITDTNAADLGVLLANIGVDHTNRQTVGDHHDRAVEAIKLALTRSDVVFTIGGLGPTPDDLTRQAIADALEDTLVRDESLVEHLNEQYGKRGLKMSESQFNQADRPTCGVPIPNANGTAPGLYCQKNDKHLFSLPGPKNEFNPMINGPVKEILESLRPGYPIYSRTFRVCGISEASIGEQLADLMASPDPTLAPYAKIGEVHLRASTRAETKRIAEAKLDFIADEVKNRLGSAVYAEGDESLEAWIIKSLTAKNQTIATAESCTGGLLAARLTSIDGSSKVFGTGYVTYSAESKHNRLGVKEWTLLQHGTVSEETAKEMALGARGRTGSHYGISITGVAGEDPLNEPPKPKPSGLIYIGIASPKSVEVHKLNLRGDRQTIRDRTVSFALIKFRDLLLNQTPTLKV